MELQFRTVPDTNVLIASQNKNPNSPNREFFRRWLEGQFDLLYSKDMLREYIKKLLEKDIPKSDIKKLIKSIRKLGESIDIDVFHLPIYPEDIDDIPFLLCAENGEATHIISYDHHLLDLNGKYHYKICKTLEFLRDIREEKGV